MKNLTFFKIASLFIFLLNAQPSFAQLNCSDYPDWVSQAGSVGDQVHYQGSIYQNRYGNGLNPPTGNNVDPSCSSGFSNWCFVADCSSAPPTPTAAFSASAIAVDTTQTITFTNNSTDATSYSWDFGDSTTSNATSPSHQYTTAGSYTVSLTATNSSGSDTATTSITVYTAGTCSAVGTILMEKYDGITGTAISDLTGSANYPQSPSSDAQLTSFEISTDTDDNYGVRVNGYICAPQTGYYTFWIASDDNGQLNISTDDDPANKTTIASVGSWTSSREWNKYTTQKSDSILLIMGESYYVEALMKEAGGGDNLAVGWAKPGEATDAPSQVIPGSVLSPAESNYVAPEDLFYENFDGESNDATNGTDAYGTNWDTDVQSSSPDDFKVKDDEFKSKKTEGEAILFTDPIDIGFFTDLKLSSFIDFGGNMESDDFIKFQYKLDGGVLTDVPNAAYYDINSDDTYEWPLTGITGTTLEIYITFDTDGGGEEHKIDNLKLTGVLDCSSASSEVTSAAASASDTQATVTWVNPSANCITINEVLVMAKQGSDFSSATPSGSYSASSTFESGDPFDGGFTVYSSGTAQSVSVTGLTDGAIYYFKIFTKTGSTWSSGVSVNAVCKENLFFEDFEDEADNDITGTDANGISWSATLNSHDAEYFGVDTQSSKLFRVDDLEDGETGIKWESNTINISEYENLELSSSLWFYGTDSNDYLRVKIEVDGVTTTVASFDDDVNDQGGDKSWTLLDNNSNPITGSSLKLIIEFYHDSNEEYWVDNIKLFGALKLPGCAENLAPADTATDVSVTPTLSWDAPSSGGPVEIYKIYYGTDSSTSTYFGETANTSVTLPQLENNTQYFWKVVPTNARGDASGCDAISFTTIFPAPGCATYTSPTDGATDVSVTPELSWSTVSGATGYKVYYGADSGTSTFFGETANTSVTLPQLGYETQYFWKVVPTNAGGDASGCSVISFTTLKNPAGCLFVTGSSITVSKNAYLYLEKDFTNTEGSVVLNSDSNEFASIIVEGTATGDITYNKYVNYVGSDEWDLVGSPVTTQSISDFVTTNDDPLAIDPTGPTYYALGTHDAATNSWTNYTASTVSSAGDFTPAKGYQMATDYGATMAFTGVVATTTQTINIQNQNGANGGVGVRWNLVANPFPSYIKGNIAADATHNFLKVNDNIIDSSFLAAYGWKADGTGYEIYNYATGSTGIGSPLLIAPGQGFFVAAASSDVAQVQFTPEMRTIAGGDDFINGAPILLNYNFDLKLFHGNTEKAETKYFFHEGLTLGLDPGYDAGALDQLTPLSSRLLETDTGVNLHINAMSLESAYNQTIPLVINQQEGQTFRISISNNTLPEDINVYLEDVLNGTLTSLKSQDFELSAQEDLSDEGRFYLHFTTQSLAIDDVLNPNNINLYKLNTDPFITIKGLTPDMGKTSAALYNILGMKVRQKTLNTSQDTQHISTQGLAGGVYIIELKAGDIKFSKKVIIQ